MPTKTESEVEQESTITDLISTLRDKLTAIGDKDCLATLDKLDQAVAAESGEEENRPLVDSSMDSPEIESEESETDESAESSETQEDEQEAGIEKPVAKKYPVEQFDTEGM